MACASYRCGQDLHDEREGTTYKFTRQDRVASSEIIAPDYAEPWATDRAKLWNSLEAVEKRKDAQLAKEIEVSLPNELPLRQQRELLAGWIDEQFTKKGLIADVNIHRSPIGAEVENVHAHVMTTLRAIDPETGSWRKTKDRTFMGKEDDIEQLRASWASHVNVALSKTGWIEDRVDHRSHKRRGITDVLPGIHVGYASKAIEERGQHSWRAALNRQIRQTNKRILAGIKTTAAATYKLLAQKAAAETVGLQLTPDAQTSAPKKQESAPAPITAQPEPTKRPETLPIEVVDEEAEKRKKAAHQAAWRQHGNGIGG